MGGVGGAARTGDIRRDDGCGLDGVQWSVSRAVLYGRGPVRREIGVQSDCTRMRREKTVLTSRLCDRARTYMRTSDVCKGSRGAGSGESGVLRWGGGRISINSYISEHRTHVVMVRLESRDVGCRGMK
jgi:hypothetical protein